MDRVLVTGGSAGIGRAIVERLSADGCDCVAISRRPPIEPFPGRWLQADLADPVSTAAVLAEATGHGPITRLVNNVGTVFPAAMEEAGFADLERAVSLNLRCSLQCAQALLPAMKRAHFGRIVNISSRAALGKECRSVYAATKAGLHGLTRTWALELGRYGITVNVVAPGPVGTELFETVNPPSSPRRQALLDAIPVRRIGSPDDVAHAVSAFLDARAGFITGQELYVCGGLSVGAVK